MNRILIDANVILRYLLDDVDDMALMAEQIIEGGAWTTPTVLAETTYVLEKIYGFSRQEISAALNIVHIHVETRPYEVVGRAIREYEETNLDFVDCMLVAYRVERGERVFTFDKGINGRLAKLKEAEVEARAEAKPEDRTEARAEDRIKARIEAKPEARARARAEAKKP